MKLNRVIKKITSYICAIALVVTSMVGYHTTVRAAVPEGYTELSTEGWHPLGTDIKYTIGNDNDPVSEWSIYSGNDWANVKASYKDGADGQNTVSVYVESPSNNGEWGLQLGKVFAGLEANKTYAYQIDYTIDGNAAKWIGIENADYNGQVKIVKALGTLLGAEKTFTVTQAKVFDPSETDLTQKLAYLTTDRNLAYKKTATVSSYKEGDSSLVALTDGTWSSWSNYVGVNTPGYFEIDLGQEYKASSIDQVVVWFRSGNGNLYPSSGFKVQFGNIVFKDVATVTSYPTGADSSNTDGSQYMVTADVDKTKATGNVRKVRIQVDQSVTWGTQIAEIAVFSENPEAPVYVEPANNPASVTVSSEQSNTMTGEIKFNITAAENQEGYTYAVFVDDSTSATYTDCVAGKDYTITGIASGKHTIKIVSVYNEGVSTGIVSDEVTVKTIVDDVKDFSKNFAYTDSWELEGGQSAEGTGSITNGTIASNDYATPTKGIEGTYFIIDLAEECKASDIKNVYVWYREANGGCAPESEGQQIQFSTDKENWTTVGTVSQDEFNKQKNAQGSAPYNIITKIDASEVENVRYVRIFYPGKAAYGAQVTEVAVFGDVPESQIPKTPAVPTGLVKDEELPYGFKWNSVDGAAYYNIYIDNQLVGTSETTSFNAFSYFVTAGAGNYKVSVSAIENKMQLESEKVTIDFKAVAVKPIISSDGNYMENPNWDMYVGDWLWCDGTLHQNKGTIVGDFNTTGGGWADALWGITAKSEKIVVDAGKKYIYSADILADKNMRIKIQMGEIDEFIDINANETYTYTVEITATTNYIEVLYAFGGTENNIALNVHFTVGGHKLMLKKEEPSTEKPTVKPTDKPSNPTVKPTTKVTVKKTSVKKASKKLSSKKVKLTIKKITGAKGYLVQVSTTKKFKKVLYKKSVKKYNTYISSKKLKNKKKLYVRVKAYKKVNGKKIYASKWSNAKKISVSK